MTMHVNDIYTDIRINKREVISFMKSKMKCIFESLFHFNREVYEMTETWVLQKHLIYRRLDTKATFIW